MVYILGASSFHHAIEAWKRCKRRHLFDSNIIAIPGLHLNRQSRAQHKLVQVIRKEVSADEGFILWHDAINNSIGKHPVDPRPPCPLKNWYQNSKTLKVCAASSTASGRVPKKYLQLPGSNRYPSPQSSERSPFEAEAERPEATTRNSIKTTDLKQNPLRS